MRSALAALAVAGSASMALGQAQFNTGAFSLASPNMLTFTFQKDAAGSVVDGFSIFIDYVGDGGNTWASDTNCMITAPDGQTVSIGGFGSPSDLDYDYQGSVSANPGTYGSGPHFGWIDGGPSQGTYTVKLTQDFGIGIFNNFQVNILREQVGDPCGLQKDPDQGAFWNPLGPDGSYVYANTFVPCNDGQVSELGTWLLSVNGAGAGPDIRFEVWGALDGDPANGPDASHVIASTGSLDIGGTDTLDFYSAPTVYSGTLSSGETYFFVATCVGEAGAPNDYQVGGHTQNSGGIIDNGTFWYSNDPLGIAFDGQGLTPEMAFKVTQGSVPGGKLSSVEFWDGVAAVSSWGDPNTATYGQTFTAPSNSMTSMSFFVSDVQDDPISYSAYVYAWDGSKASGPAVFASGQLQTDGIDFGGGGFQQIVVPTPGATLTPGDQYVAFLSCSNYFPTGGGASWGNSGADAFPGTFVFQNNGDNFNALFTDPWSQDFLGPGVDLAACFTFGPSGNFYMDSGNRPWGSGDYDAAMNTNFGKGGWSALTYDADINALLNAADFIYMEGSDSSADELNAFLQANLPAIMNWVGNGGRLLLNAAPNEGANIDFGFGGVLLTYPDFDGANEAHAVNGAHPVFNEPFGAIATDYTGTSFSHSTLSGGGISAIMVNGAGNTVLAENSFNGGGAGLVVFGAMTAPQFHDPDPDSQILLENIIAYAASGTPSGCFADCDGNGVLNILDFVCYQGLFQAGDPGADCDGNGVLNILDFVCFQGAFQAGCP